jgi:hypothetical protein
MVASDLTGSVIIVDSTVVVVVVVGRSAAGKIVETTS